MDVAGWLGSVGHNWGTQLAQRRIWLQSSSFRENQAIWLDIVISRVRLGPITAP